MSPAASDVSVSGTGCSNAAVVSIDGAYSLTATRSDAGTRECTVTAGTAPNTATASITVTFAVDPAPQIIGLPASADATAGTPFTQGYAVSPAASDVSVSGTGCSNAAVVSIDGAYSLTATRSDAGTRECTVTAGTAPNTATASITVTFAVDPAPQIIGLPASADATAGTPFTQGYAVSPAASDVSVSGTGCSNAAVVSIDGAYSLTATRSDAGTRECTVTAGTAPNTATASITVTFAAVVVHTRVPRSPRNARCSAATGITATWTWDAADRAHSYWYRYSDSDSWTQAGDANTRSHTRTDFTPNGGYGGWANWRYFKLIARNNIGDSSQRRLRLPHPAPRLAHRHLHRRRRNHRQLVQTARPQQRHRRPLHRHRHLRGAHRVRRRHPRPLQRHRHHVRPHGRTRHHLHHHSPNPAHRQQAHLLGHHHRRMRAAGL